MPPDLVLLNTPRSGLSQNMALCHRSLFTFDGRKNFSEEEFVALLPPGQLVNAILVEVSDGAAGPKDVGFVATHAWLGRKAALPTELDALEVTLTAWKQLNQGSGDKSDQQTISTLKSLPAQSLGMEKKDQNEKPESAEKKELFKFQEAVSQAAVPLRQMDTVKVTTAPPRNKLPAATFTQRNALSDTIVTVMRLCSPDLVLLNHHDHGKVLCHRDFFTTLGNNNVTKQLFAMCLATGSALHVNLLRLPADNVLSREVDWVASHAWQGPNQSLPICPDPVGTTLIAWRAMNQGSGYMSGTQTISASNGPPAQSGGMERKGQSGKPESDKKKELFKFPESSQAGIPKKKPPQKKDKVKVTTATPRNKLPDTTFTPRNTLSDALVTVVQLCSPDLVLLEHHDHGKVLCHRGFFTTLGNNDVTEQLFAMCLRPGNTLHGDLLRLAADNALIGEVDWVASHAWQGPKKSFPICSDPVGTTLTAWRQQKMGQGGRPDFELRVLRRISPDLALMEHANIGTVLCHRRFFTAGGNKDISEEEFAARLLPGVSLHADLLPLRGTNFAFAYVASHAWEGPRQSVPSLPNPLRTTLGAWGSWNAAQAFQVGATFVVLRLPTPDVAVMKSDVLGKAVCHRSVFTAGSLNDVSAEEFAAAAKPGTKVKLRLVEVAPDAFVQSPEERFGVRESPDESGAIRFVAVRAWTGPLAAAKAPKSPPADPVAATLQAWRSCPKEEP